MKFRGIDIDFSFLDTDDLEKFDKKGKELKKKFVDLEYGNNYIEQIKEGCRLIDEFLNEVFGSGIAEKIFKGKNNLDEHMKVFLSLIDLREEELSSVNKNWNNIMDEKKEKYDAYKPQNDRNYRNNRNNRYSYRNKNNRRYRR